MTDTTTSQNTDLSSWDTLCNRPVNSQVAAQWTGRQEQSLALCRGLFFSCTAVGSATLRGGVSFVTSNKMSPGCSFMNLLALASCSNHHSSSDMWSYRCRVIHFMPAVSSLYGMDKHAIFFTQCWDENIRTRKISNKRTEKITYCRAS